MKRDTEEELKVTTLQIVKLNQQIVSQCTAEIAEEGVAVAPVKNAAANGKPSTVPSGLEEAKDFLPSMEDFRRMVDAKPNTTIQQDVQDRMVDKTLNEVIPINTWPDREGKMRGSGWKPVTTAGELAAQDRVCVAQMSKDGQRVSVVEGRVTGIEMDGGVSVDVGGNIVEVDTKGAASKIYRLNQ